MRTPGTANASRPLTPGFGVEVNGLDLSKPMDGPVVAELRALFDRYLVLLFRAPHLPPDAQIAFSRNFGELQMHPHDQDGAAGQELFVLSNVGPDGSPNREHPDRATLVWHTDGSFLRRPPYATFLYAEAVPAAGGHTLFADTLSAFEALSGDDRKYLPTLRVIHDIDISRKRAGYGPLPRERRGRTPPVEHPLVRVHPPTGRRGIYLGSPAARINGLSDHESAGLIARLMAHVTESRFVYDHAWQPGDLLMWDNRAVLHRATEYETTIESRIMRRTVVKSNESD